MDAAALADFTYLAMFLAHGGDREVEGSELRSLLHSVGQVALEHGVAAAQAKQIAADAAKTFFDDHDALPERALAEAVLRRIDSLASGTSVARLYRELVQISASDGQSEAGEVTILGVVRTRWGLA